jgi:putative ABC transport system permease protein
VVGVTQGAVDSGGNPLVYLSLPDAQKVQFEQDNRALDAARAGQPEAAGSPGSPGRGGAALLPLLSRRRRTVNAVLVELAPGADGGAVAQHVRDWLLLQRLFHRGGAHR